MNEFKYFSQFLHGIRAWFALNPNLSMDAQRGNNHERVSEIHSSMGPVGAFDNSPLHLTVEKLNGKNYREWVQSIKLVIDGKGKLGFLTGETRRPPLTDVAASQKWQFENSFITSCLINSMKPAI